MNEGELKKRAKTTEETVHEMWPSAELCDLKCDCLDSCYFRDSGKLWVHINDLDEARKEFPSCPRITGYTLTMWKNEVELWYLKWLGDKT